MQISDLKAKAQSFEIPSVPELPSLPDLPALPEGPIVPGQGKTCAYIAVVLSCLSLLTVLAIKFPTYLTVAELRDAYGPSIAGIRLVLQAGMIGAAGLALFNIARDMKLLPATITLVLLAAAQLLGGADVVVGEITATPISAGVDWLVISLLVVGGAFIVIEKAAPLNKGQPILREKWVLDMKYFVINHLLLGFFVVFTNTALNALFAWAQYDATAVALAQVHPVLQFFMIMVLIDLMQYATHRIMHEVPFLWKFHAVHHSSEKLDWLASSRMHVLEPLVMRVAMLTPIFILGFGEGVVNIYAAFVGVQAILLHANVKAEFGLFEKIFVVARHHHWHHANEEQAINKNYAVHFPIIDRIFGTMLDVDGWPKAYGVSETLPDTVLGQAAYPFMPSKAA